MLPKPSDLMLLQINLLQLCYISHVEMMGKNIVGWVSWCEQDREINIDCSRHGPKNWLTNTKLALRYNRIYVPNPLERNVTNKKTYGCNTVQSSTGQSNTGNSSEIQLNAVESNRIVCMKRWMHTRLTVMGFLSKTSFQEERERMRAPSSISDVSVPVSESERHEFTARRRPDHLLVTCTSTRIRISTIPCRLRVSTWFMSLWMLFPPKSSPTRKVKGTSCRKKIHVNSFECCSSWPSFIEIQRWIDLVRRIKMNGYLGVFTSFLQSNFYWNSYW